MESKETTIHSFVICAYQDSAFLEDCIKSLLDQSSVKKGKSKVLLFTTTPSEFIESLCKKYQIPLFLGKSKGIGANWNEALSVVNTKFATIAHQDDIYFSNYGEEILTIFENHNKVALAFSDYQEIETRNKKRGVILNLFIKRVGLRILSLIKSSSYQYRVLSLGNFICCPAVSFNLEELSGLRFDESLKFIVDWDMWMRVLEKKKQIKYLAKILMSHRIHSESETTKSIKSDIRLEEENSFFQKYWNKGMAKFLLRFYVHSQKGNNE